MVQEGVAVLLVLYRVNGRSLAGEGGCDCAALAQLFPSSGGESRAPPLALQTQMCADLRRPEAPHLALRTHLIQLHGGFLIPGGNRRLLYSPLQYNMMRNIMERNEEQRPLQQQKSKSICFISYFLCTKMFPVAVVYFKNNLKVPCGVFLYVPIHIVCILEALQTR